MASMFATENSPDSSCRQARFSSLSLDACLSEHLGTRPVQVVAGRKKEESYFFRFFFSIICLLFSLFFDQNTKTTFLIKRRSLLLKKRSQIMTCFVIFSPFFRLRGFFFCDQKALLFSIKNFPLFSSWCVDHISFFSAGTGPLHIKWDEICASIPRQICFSTFFAKRRREPCTVSGPQGKSELCVQRADSTSDH